MSNTSNINLITEAYELCKSIIYKFHQVGVDMNISMRVVDLDKNRWKYYMNLQGEPYPDVDATDIVISHTDGSTVNHYNLVSLQKMATLGQTPSVAYLSMMEELKERGVLYKSLLQKYPRELVRINAILEPVDINDVYSWDDGTILWYNKTLIADNEYELFYFLEKRIQSFIRRWNVGEYVISDVYYTAGFIANLSNYIVSSIMSYRLGNIGTIKAHHSLVYEGFKSNLSLHELVWVMGYGNMMWLYKNITPLRPYIGIAEVFEDIIANIFKDSSIRPYRCVIEKKKQYDRGFNVFDRLGVSTDPAVASTYRVINKPYQSSHYFTDNRIKLLNMIDPSDDSKVLTASALWYGDVETKKINDNIRIISELTLDASTIVISAGITVWLYYIVDVLLLTRSNNPNYEYTITFEDLNDRKGYTLTLSEITLLVLYCMDKIYGGNGIAKEHKVKSVLNKTIAVATVTTYRNRQYNKLSLGAYNKMVSLLSSYPAVSSIIDRDSGVTFMWDNVNWFSMYSELLLSVSNSDRILLESAVNGAIEAHIPISIFQYVGTIKYNLESNGIFLNKGTTYRYDVLLHNILYAYSGVNAKLPTCLNDYIRNFSTVVDRLSSHTTNVIPLMVRDNSDAMNRNLLLQNNICVVGVECL